MSCLFDRYKLQQSGFSAASAKPFILIVLCKLVDHAQSVTLTHISRSNDFVINLHGNVHVSATLIAARVKPCIVHLSRDM